MFEVNKVLIMKKIILLLIFLNSVCIYSQNDYNKIDNNGKKQGLWKGYYEDTKHLRYEGNFEHGVEVGKFTFYDNTKVKKIVATRDFTDNGTRAYTIFYRGRFKVSEGLIVNKQYEGLWKYYHLDMEAIMTIENYKKGKLDGDRKVFYKSGELAEECKYDEGKIDGVYKKYAENGVVIEETHYKNGLLNGLTVFKETNGTIATTGQHKKGKAVGIWKFYKNGKLLKEEDMSIKKKARPKKVN